jgi:hypothetical protein
VTYLVAVKANQNVYFRPLEFYRVIEWFHIFKNLKTCEKEINKHFTILCDTEIVFLSMAINWLKKIKNKK